MLLYYDTVHGSDLDPPLLCVVSMSMVRPGSSLNHYKVLTVSLAVLATILLAVDIGMGIYCKSLLTHKELLDLQYCENIVVLNS